MKEVSFQEILRHVRDKRVKLDCNQDHFRYAISKDVYSEALVNALKKYKDVLIRYFFSNIKLDNIITFNENNYGVATCIVHGEEIDRLLLSTLEGNYTYYGFTHIGSEGEKIPFKNTEELVNNYMRQLLLQKHEGPFILGGYSFGGMIAYEMALQLQELGYVVPKLVLFDSMYAGVKIPYHNSKGIVKLKHTCIYGDIYGRLKFNVWAGFFYLKFMFRNKLELKFRKRYILHTYFKFARKYCRKFENFKGEVMLFKSRELSVYGNVLGWDNMFETLEVFDLEGEHYDFFKSEKGKTTILDKFTSYLKKADEDMEKSVEVIF